MSEFLLALTRHAFLQNALLAGLLASLGCGVVGTFVVARRITYLAGAIAHSVLGGMGAAHYLAATGAVPWLHPLHGAVAAAIAAAVIIGLVSLHAGQREDTIIGALWALGMAAGIIFISRTPGYNVELMSYLFGNILMVTGRDLVLMAALDGLLLALVAWLFYHPLVAICFDEEFARARGLPVDLYYLLLLVLTSLTVVLLTTVVGIVMVIALLTLPAAIAGVVARSLRAIMALAVLISAGLTSGGLAVSFVGDLPTGATIIVLAGGAYLLVMLGRSLRRR